MKLEQTLFDNKINRSQNIENEPLSYRFIPDSLDEFIGQEHILEKNKLLRRIVESDRLGSMIFFGPSGTGKTTLTRIIALQTKSHFIETNAVTIGVAEIRKIIEESAYRKEVHNKKTILVLDEIHHFNRTQQDALLPDVEKGIITLIGITTENPYFYVNPALVSRSLVFEFKPHSKKEIKAIIQKATQDKKIGLGKFNINMADKAIEHITNYSEGDARRALNALEIGVLTTAPDKNNIVNFTLEIAEECLQRKAILYDKSSDQHYDHISAFIKSMRGSDPDAAVYWLTKMLTAGEDPRFIARRIVICASEDIGNADPLALVVAVSALKSVEFVGMPEAKIPLAQAAIYVACANKSNASYMALMASEEELSKGPLRKVPDHLKDSSRDSETLSHGKGYLYPHEFEGHFIPQEYMPEHKIFYEPSDQGYELKIKERLEKWRKQQKPDGKNK